MRETTHYGQVRRALLLALLPTLALSLGLYWTLMISPSLEERR